MWIAKLVLRRPYTFVVMALLILLLGVVSIKATPTDKRTLLVPGNAVMIRSDGAKVMIVDDQHAIRFRPVKLGRDLGEKIEILSGLDAGDSLVDNPSDALREGLEVKVQSPLPAKL